MQAIIGQKQSQSQAFLEDGTRIPVTRIIAPAVPVVSTKTKEKAGYWALQLGFGTTKHPNKAELGHVRGAKLEKAPRFLREVRLTEDEATTMPQVGDYVKAMDIFKPGDIVDVIGVSKGKGYAGVVKKFNFKGGPRTHGQSDRERARGSSGQTTTPGRVYKGKRMSGRMGNERVTIKNVEIVDVTEDMILIHGLVPGGVNSLVTIRKVGEGKNFVPLLQKVSKDEKVSEVSKGEAEETAIETTPEEKVEEAPQEESNETKVSKANSAKPKVSEVTKEEAQEPEVKETEEPKEEK